MRGIHIPIKSQQTHISVFKILLFFFVFLYSCQLYEIITKIECKRFYILACKLTQKSVMCKVKCLGKIRNPWYSVGLLITITQTFT